MTRFFKLLLVSLFLLTVLIVPTNTAQAQSVGTFNCDNFGNTPREPESVSEGGPEQQVKANVNNALLNILTYGTLRQRLQCDPLIVGRRDTEGNVETVSIYRFAQNLVNFAVLIILIAIAFSNILRIKLDTYEVKKAVPLLIFGVIMANVALPIIRTIVDFSQVLTVTFIGETGLAGTSTSFIETLISTVYNGGATTLGNVLNGLEGGNSNVWTDAFAIIGIYYFAIAAAGPAFVIVTVGFLALILIPAIMFFFLGLLFVVRIYVLVILAAVSPLAFASLGYNPLKGKLWGWWWKQFINWTFMTPATFALMWISVQFFRATGGRTDLGTYIVTLALMGMAIQIPLKMGGSWMQKWSQAVATPIKNAMLTPFTAARSYVQKAAPKDISRALSVRGRNYGRQFKEISKAIDEKNAAIEANSLSVKRGKYQGALVTSMGLRKSLLDKSARSDFEKGVYQSEIGRAQAAEEARRFFRTTGIDTSLHWRDIEANPELLKKYTDNIDKYQNSKDKDQIAATMLVNGMIGRTLDPKEQQELLAKLSKNNIDTTPINKMYERLLAEKGIIVATPDDAQGKSGSDAHDAMVESVLKKIDRNLANMNTKDQEQALMKILQQLKDSGVQLRELAEIEKNPNYQAWANALLKYSEHKEFANLRREVEATPLATHRDALGMPDVNLVFNIKEYGDTLASQLSDKHIDMLKKIASGSGLSGEGIHQRLSETELGDLINLRKNAILFREMKDALEKYLVAQLNAESLRNPKAIDGPRVQEIKTQIIEPKLNVLDEDALPKTITSTDFVNMGIDPQIAQRLEAILRPYNATAKTLAALEETHSEEIKKNVEEEIAGA